MINNYSQRLRQKLKTFIHSLSSFAKLQKLLLHTAFALTFTSGLSYVFGFLRDKIFAYKFGASSSLDIYYAAFTIPDLILAFFVTSSIGVAFIPIFTQLHKKRERESYLYTKDILFWLALAITFCGIIVAIFMPSLVRWLVPGFDPEQQKLYVSFVRIMLISPVIFSFSNVFGGVLITTKDFFFYGIAPVFYNIGIIFGIFFLVPVLGLTGLAWGTIIGALLHMLVRFFIFNKKSKIVFQKPRLTKEIKQTFKLSLPKSMQILSWQILLIWFVRLASNLEDGSVTIYNIARNFQSMPVSLIGIAIALSTFSTLNHLASKNQYTEFKQLIKKKGTLILALTSLAAIFLAGTSFVLIKILFGGGAFTESAVNATASLLVVYTLSIPLESLMHLMARAHYALGNTLIPSVINIFTIILTIIISLFFIESTGIYIIPISFAIGLLTQNALLLVSYRLLLTKVSAPLTKL
jgi:putative peptidoglycan lipid II flippase